MRRLVIAATGFDMDGPIAAYLTLTEDYIKYLHEQMEAVRISKMKDVAYVACWDISATFFDETGNGLSGLYGPAYHDDHFLEPECIVPPMYGELRTDTDLLFVYAGYVVWNSQPRHGGGYYETVRLTREALRRYANELGLSGNLEPKRKDVKKQKARAGR